MERSRLNVARGIADRLTEPQMQSALARYIENNEPAAQRLESVLAQTARA